MRKVKRIVQRAICGLLILSLFLQMMPITTLAEAAELQITKQPDSIMVETGTNAPFSVVATGDGLTYLWQYKLAGSETWVDWTSKTTASISVAYLKSRDGMTLRCAITDATGASVTSSEATLTYGTPVQPLAITKHPDSINVAKGANAEFSVTATGEGLTYLWQYKEAGTDLWVDWTSKKSPSISVAYLKSRDGMMLRCVVTDATGNSLTSDEATLTYGTPVPTLVITKHPDSVNVAKGANAEFSVTASGEGLTYLWQYKEAGTDLWVDWTSKKTPSISVAYLKNRDGMMLRCVVTDATGASVTSNEATLTYGTPAPVLAITKHPENINVEKGANAEFSVTATGEGLTYLWQYKLASANTWVDWTSKKTPSISVAYLKSRNGMILRCVVTDATGTSITSDEATLTYGTPITYYTITYSAGDGTFADGNNTYSVQVEAGRFDVNNVEAPTWAGHEFAGWLYNGQRVDWLTISSDITLTADWSQVYTISYDANGGTFPTDWEVNEEGYYFNQDRTVMSEPWEAGGYHVPEYIEPVKDSCNFLGWTLNGQIVSDITITDSDVTLVAAWETGYVVTYNANGGSWKFNEDEAPFYTYEFVQPAGTYYLGWHEPERPGYRFEGWTYEGQYVRKINIQSNVTIMATWRKECMVTYDANGGQFENVWDDLADKRVSGKTITRRADEGDYWVGVGDDEEPSYVYQSNAGTTTQENVNYVFCGWSTDKNATPAQAERGFNLNLTDNVTVYAIWGSEHSITLDGNDGILYFDDQEFEELEGYFHADPRDGFELNIWADRDGYEFLGWSTNKDAVVAEYQQNDRIYPTEDVTVYAIWKQYPTVTYDANGGYWNRWDDKQQKDVKVYFEYDWRNYGRYYHVRYEQPERQGYRFDGWMDAENKLVDESVPIKMTKDYSYKAKWVKQITVTYDANGGSWGNQTTRTWDGEEGMVHIGEEWPSKWENNVELCFVGWSTKKDATEAEEDFDLELHDDVTYYAIWHLPLTVTYDANGGWLWDTPNGRVTTDVREDVRYGNFDVDQWANRDGYEFLGWSTDEKATEPDYPIHGDGDERRAFLKGDTTFYAVWKKLPWIIYDANGGWWGEDDEQTADVDEREYIQFDWDNPGYYYYIGHHNPDRPGYEFNGWVDEEENRVDDKELILEDGKDITVKASWSRRINVIYDGNGGKFDTPEGQLDEHMQEDVRTECDYWLDMWEPHYRIEGDGEYFFMGWAFDKAGTQMVSNPWVIPNDVEVDAQNCIRLYAVWDEGITITYDANGGFWTEYDEKTNRYYTYTTRKQGSSPSNQRTYHIGEWWPERYGYMFLGWSTKADATDALTDFDVALTENATYYAIWDECPMVTFDAGDGYFTEDNHESTIILPWRTGNTLEGYQTMIYNDWIDGMDITPNRNGYEFAGWVDENGNPFRFKRITGNVTIYASWRSNG